MECLWPAARFDAFKWSGRVVWRSHYRVGTWQAVSSLSVCAHRQKVTNQTIVLSYLACLFSIMLYGSSEPIGLIRTSSSSGQALQTDRFLNRTPTTNHRYLVTTQSNSYYLTATGIIYRGNHQKTVNNGFLQSVLKLFLRRVYQESLLVALNVPGWSASNWNF